MVMIANDRIADVKAVGVAYIGLGAVKRKNIVFECKILSSDFAAARKKQRKKPLLPSKNRHYVDD